MNFSDVEGLKAQACSLIDKNAETLINVSHEIHDHPEENYEEVFASELLTRTANGLGMPVELGAFDCATGFSGDVGSGPTVCIMSEYDALPDIGHGCGHNVIAAAGLGAAIALASIAEVSRVVIRTRTALGTGSCLEIDSGLNRGVRPEGCGLGTSVEVHQLFSKIPARRAFLKTPATEWSHASEAFVKTALAHPEIAFSLTHNRRRVHDLPAVVDWRQRIADLYGSQLASRLLHAKEVDEDISVTALLGRPEDDMASGRFQHFFISGAHHAHNDLLETIVELVVIGFVLFISAVFFILLTFIGGSLISTSSGFKYTRIYILLKISYQEIYRLVKPLNVIDKNLYNVEAKIDDQDLKIAFLVFISLIISTAMVFCLTDNLFSMPSNQLASLAKSILANSWIFFSATLKCKDSFFNLAASQTGQGTFCTKSSKLLSISSALFSFC